MDLATMDTYDWTKLLDVVVGDCFPVNLSDSNTVITSTTMPVFRESKPKRNYIESTEESEKFMKICDMVHERLPEGFTQGLALGEIYTDKGTVKYIPKEFMKMNASELDFAVFKFVEDLKAAI